MSAKDIFDDDVAQRLEAVYRTPEMVAQRRRTIEVLAPRAGERIFDIGTEPGLLALDLADHVAPAGHVTGIDVSHDMLALAKRHRRRSLHADVLTFRHGDATALPFTDAAFDALASTKSSNTSKTSTARSPRLTAFCAPAVAFLSSTPTGIPRLARPRPRSHVQGHRGMEQALRRSPPADHAATTPPGRRLRIRVAQVVPILNADFDPDTYSARHIEIISDYVTHHGMPPDDAAAWADDLRERAQSAEYFFSLNRYVFTAQRP